MSDQEEGVSVSFSKTLTEADLQLHAAAHRGGTEKHGLTEGQCTTMVDRRVAHDLLVSALMSAITRATVVPQSGAFFVDQRLRFLRPIRMGDTLTITTTARTEERQEGRIVLEAVCRNQLGEPVLTGDAVIRYRP